MVWVVNCYTVAAVAQASCVLKLRRPVPATGRVVGLFVYYETLGLYNWFVATGR